MSMSRRAFLAVVPAGALAACASSGGESESAAPDRNVLTREEMSEIRVANLYEAVERLRPRWLQIRAPRSMIGQTEIVVFMNRSLLGGPDILRQFNPSNVARLRYMDGPTASAQFAGLGARAIEGAIIIEVT